jgi:hypothetical protein
MDRMFLMNIQKEILNIQVKLNSFLEANNLPLEIHSDIAYALKKLVEANSWIQKAISNY